MFKAVVVPVVTPVDTQDRVDEEAYRSLLRFLIGAGVHGIVVGGTAAQRSRAAADRFVSCAIPVTVSRRRILLDDMVST